MANIHVNQAGDGWLGRTLDIGEVKSDLNLPPSTHLSGTITVSLAQD